MSTNKRAPRWVVIPLALFVSSTTLCLGAIAAEPAVPMAPSSASPGTVAAGTTMMLSMDQALSSDSTAVGQSFTATLESDLVGQNGQVVIPMGNKAFGKIVQAKSAGHVVGKSEMSIEFTDVRVNGQLIPIQAQGVQASGQGSGRSTARKVGAGALIGAAFGRGRGAAVGAMIGGAAAVLTRGDQINIPKGTLLDVKLSAPLVSRVGTPAPVATPAAAPAPSGASGQSAEQKKQECIKKLMAQGFSADDAISTCGMQ